MESKPWSLCALCLNFTLRFTTSCALCQNSKHGFTTSLLRNARHGVCLNCAKTASMGLHFSCARQGMVCVPCAKIKRGRECALCQNPTHGIHDISPSQVKAWCTPCGKIPIVGLRHLSFGRQGMACVWCQASIYDIHSPTIAITDYANGWRSNCSEFVTIQTAKLIQSRVSITFITTTCI